MAFFGNSESKEAKKEEKLNALMAKYGLENLSPEYREKVKFINNELMGTGLGEAGMAFSFAKVEEQVKVSYLRALVEQNWMIIRLLDEIAKK